MDCSRAQSQLGDYEDRELFGEERNMLEAHLRGCELCAKVRRSLRAVWSALDTLPAQEPDPLAARRFFAKIQKQGMQRTFSYALAAATFVVALGAGWFLNFAGGSANPGADFSSPSPDTVFSDTASGQNGTQAESTFSNLAFGESNTPFAEAMFTNEEETP